MILDPAEMGPAAAAPAPGDGQQRRQPPRVLFQQLDTEQFSVGRGVWTAECRLAHTAMPRRSAMITIRTMVTADGAEPAQRLHGDSYLFRNQVTVEALVAGHHLIDGEVGCEALTCGVGQGRVLEA